MILEVVINFYDDFNAFLKWLERMKSVGTIKNYLVEGNGEVVRIHGQVNTAMYRQADPVANFVCLAMALFGPFWIYLQPVVADFEDIKKWWKKRVKSSRNKSEDISSSLENYLS